MSYSPVNRCAIAEPKRASAIKRAQQWAIANRTTVRLAFVLRLGTTIIGSVMSLIWTRLLLLSMGDVCYGLFASFQGVTGLGGLGDFGIMGAIAIRTGQMVGAKEEQKLYRFIAGARSLMLIVLFGVPLLFLASSPWLPGWLGFQAAPGSGSMQLLFATAAPVLFCGLLSCYVNALNAGQGTVTWQILPGLVFSQIGIALQWVGAKTGAPLWTQQLLLITGNCGLVLSSFWMLKSSHPWLGNLTPIRWDREVLRELFRTSAWSYLYSIGLFVYVLTDRIVINSGFGAGVVPRYMLNAKLCELAMQIIGMASSVSVPKITHWISSNDPSDFDRAGKELARLNLFQTLLASIAGFAYLAVNSWFIRFWLGRDYSVPYSWSSAFVLNLVITAACNAPYQASSLCGKNGLRFTGISIGLTALVNLGLSFLSMKQGSIAGIAVATIIAQTILGLVLTWNVCRHLCLSYREWLIKAFVLPITAMILGLIARGIILPQTIYSFITLLAVDLLIFSALAISIGFKFSLLRDEWQIFRKIFGLGR